MDATVMALINMIRDVSRRQGMSRRRRVVDRGMVWRSTDSKCSIEQGLGAGEAPPLKNQNEALTTQSS